MSNSVTENAHSVTDVRAALANVGFDAGRILNQFELVIDKFDQWTNPQGSLAYCSNCAYGASVALRSV